MSKKDILLAAQKILDSGVELVRDPFTGEQTTTAARDRNEALLKPLEKALKTDDLIGRYSKQGAFVSSQSSMRFRYALLGIGSCFDVFKSESQKKLLITCIASSRRTPPRVMRYSPFKELGRSVA